MRSLTIFFVFTSFQLSIAQNYTPFPDSNAIWTGSRHDAACSNPIYRCYINQLTLNGDTVIGLYSYKKIYVEGYSMSHLFPFTETHFQGYKGAIRNDIPEKKVYFVNANTAIDTLLYDFSISIGDTVPVSYINYNDYPAPWTVISIDSIYTNGQYRRRYNISNTGWETSLIEGIGSIGGLLEQYFYPEGYSDLQCFILNNTVQYPEGNNNINQCGLMSWQTPHCSDTTYLPLITGPLNICYSDTILLEAESGYDAYLWSTGDTTQSISVSEAGDYSVSALVDTCWFGSDTVEISISNPMPIVTENVNDLISSGPFVSYQWYYNDEPITVNGNYQVYTVCVDGSYYVIVTDEYGCIGQSNTIETNFCCVDKIDPCDTGIDDNNNLPVTIYPNPNPATTTITLEFPASVNFKTAELSIQTITGQVVYQSTITNPKSAIDIFAFSKGLYLFKVRAGDEVVVRKVVVE